MSESKHILTSKSFLTALVTIASGIVMMVYNVNISPDMQAGAVVVLGALIGYLRSITDKPVHIVKPKKKPVETKKEAEFIVTLKEKGHDHT